MPSDSPSVAAVTLTCTSVSAAIVYLDAGCRLGVGSRSVQALAALLSLAVPGLGQLCQGRLGIALGIVTAYCSCWIVPVLIAGAFAETHRGIALVGLTLWLGVPALHLGACVEAARWSPDPS